LSYFKEEVSVAHAGAVFCDISAAIIFNHRLERRPGMLSDPEMLLRLFVAAALGSLVGFERERVLWAAGIRTHMLVCVGSCLIMLVSQYGFSNILAKDHVVLDPSRIAA
jgi:hypothetical protein